MSIYDLLISRRTIHQYQTHPAVTELLFKALEVAVHAPNHHHTQPWRFTIVGEKVRKELMGLAQKIKSETKELSPGELKALTHKFMNPSHLIILSQVKSIDPLQSKEDYAAIACAVQNMSLFLWSEGLGSKWSSGEIICHPETYKILSIEPQNQEIVGFFWLGKALHTPKKLLKSDLRDIVREV